MNLLRSYWPLLVILTAAAALRFVALDASPPSLFRDEIEKGYNAFALLKDGVAISIVPRGAYFGIERHPWPLFLNVYNSHTSMIYQYAAMPFVAALGLNAWGTRAPAALAGTLTVLLTFLLGRELLGRRAALLAAALLAVSPWHVMFSRWAQQGIMVPLCVTLGMWALMRWLRVRGEWSAREGIGDDDDKKQSPPGTAPPTLTSPAAFGGVWLMVATAAFAVAFYAYDAGRVFVPLFASLLVALFWRPLAREWKWTLGAAAIGLALCAPTLAFMLSPESRARYEAVSGGASPGVFIVNWLAHFHPAFLFISGDANPRHSFPGFGLMHVFEAVLWLAAIPALWRLPRRAAILLIGWLVIGAVPAALTTEGIPHALRSIATLPAPSLISAVGVAWLIARLEARRHINKDKRSKVAPRAAATLTGLAVLALLFMFIRTMLVTYPRTTSPHWGSAENAIYEPGALADLNPQLPVLISPNVFYAPYFLLFHLRIEPPWLPDYFSSSIHTPETARRKQIPLFPTPAWRASDLPAACAEFYWVGPPADAWPGEVVKIIPWPHPEYLLDLAGQPAIVIRRVPRAALKPLPF